ncbi:protein DEK-like [Belonocnema kinseyi]|uniref:protein DEK-like n=1 Tax=Belonocnema kinseyi TaxID=2817044 RepID=UPI00143D70E0|nr:protein DEK-like [Belonocnema kinseyi]
MEKLVQIECVKKQLRNAPRSAISALYRLIFVEEGDRKNRSKLREFSGFIFADESEEFRKKLDYASAFSVGDLTSICNVLGLSYRGNKEHLRLSIIRALMDINTLAEPNPENESEDEHESGDDGLVDDKSNFEIPEDDNDDKDVGESEIDERDGESYQDDIPTGPRKSQAVHFSLGFKDIEETIRDFDGSENFPIERWLADFEDAAALFQWTDLQKVIFAKGSLKGLAKLFI